LDLDVKVLGISDAIVAVSADGILVSNKEKSAKIKDYLDADMPRPMFEERRWGWYRVLDFVRDAEGTDVLTKRIKVDAGKNLSLQSHNHRSEVWTVISGEGEFILNDSLRKVKKGDVLHIQVGDKHGIKATSDLEFIEVQMGTPLIEEDIIRYAMDWETAVNSLKKTVYFLCTGNSCRSQMADGFLKKHGDDRFEVLSAGLEAHGLNPRAITSMGEVGIDITTHTSDVIDPAILERADYIITLCGHADEHCPVYHNPTAHKWHWGFPDPAKATGSEAEIMAQFREVRDAIEARIIRFVREGV
jgi:thioredoxin type arsenate reductase